MTPSTVENAATTPETPRRDFRQEVTDNIVAMLEKGVAPWQKPWDPAKASLELPKIPPATGHIEEVTRFICWRSG